jgi:Uma2 family endonuclease
MREKFITVEEFEVFINLPENADKRFELIQGEIFEVTSAPPIHGQIIANIVGAMLIAVKKTDAGRFFGDSVDYYLPNGDVYAPDASFLSFERQLEQVKKLQVAPNLP